MLEYKSLDFNVKDIKEDSDLFTVEGYAAGTDNVDLGGDKIVKGAYEPTFDYVKEGRKIKSLWMHNGNEPIGVVTPIKEDSMGLFVKAELPMADSFVTSRVIPQIKIGSVDSMSIGYQVKDYEMKDGIRLLKSILIKEVSFVSFEMNENARITGFKSLNIDELQAFDIRELENIFKEGFKCSQKSAKWLVSCIKNSGQRDVEPKQRDVEAISKKLRDIRFNKMSEQIKNIINGSK